MGLKGRYCLAIKKGITTRSIRPSFEFEFPKAFKFVIPEHVLANFAVTKIEILKLTLGRASLKSMPLN